MRLIFLNHFYGKTAAETIYFDILPWQITTNVKEYKHKNNKALYATQFMGKAAL